MSTPSEDIRRSRAFETGSVSDQRGRQIATLTLPIYLNFNKARWRAAKAFFGVHYPVMLPGLSAAFRLSSRAHGARNAFELGRY